MGITQRISRGWHLGITSLEVLKDHPRLLVFPLISVAAMVALVLLILSLFVGVSLVQPEVLTQFEHFLDTADKNVALFALFAVYLVNTFIIVFFNVALVHAVREVYMGHEPRISDSLEFAASRAGTILAWSALAATVGVVLQQIEERIGWLAKSILGFGWSMATYFVVPVLAYENLGPVDALKHSFNTIRQKWGESVGAAASLGLFVVLGIFASIAAGILFGLFIHPLAGVLVGVFAFFGTLVVNSAARQIFLAAAYAHTQGNTPAYYDPTTLDGIFAQKKK